MSSRPLGAVSACVIALFTSLTHAAMLPFESRLGALAFCDPNLGITWQAAPTSMGLIPGTSRSPGRGA